MKKACFHIVLLSLFVLASCNNKEVSNAGNEAGTVSPDTKEVIVSDNADELGQEEYCNWIRNKENNLIKSKQVADITFSSLYKPTEYIACLENRKGLTVAKLDQTKKELGGLMYFDLRLSLTEGDYDLLKYKLTSQDEYSKRLNYLSFEMQKDIYLVNGNDTIPCALYHYERAYDLVNYINVSLAFDAPMYDREKTLIINDKLFNKGLIKINYQPEVFKNIPKLKVPEA